MMTLSIKIKLLTYVVLVLTTFVNIVTDQYLRISLTLYDSMKMGKKYHQKYSCINKGICNHSERFEPVVFL